MEIETIKKMIRSHEGLRLHPYKCTANKTTIGYGRNLSDRGITVEEAEYLMSNDIKNCITQLDVLLPWWKVQPEIIQMVLLDMCYNIGINGLLEFKRTLGYIRDCKYIEASSEMLKSKWAKQVGNRADKLSKMVLGCCENRLIKTMLNKDDIDAINCVAGQQAKRGSA